MTPAPIVSIITPLYRNDETLDRCLASIRVAARDADTHVESLLVLDGPAPDMQRTLASLRDDEHVHWVCIEQVHAGIAAARNTGLSCASARFVTLLDGDDEITAERLRMVKAGEGDSVVIGKQEVVSPDGMRVPGFWSDAGDPEHHVASLVAPTTWIRGVGGFDSTFTLGDDWDLVIRLREAGCPIHFDSSVFVRRHLTGENASGDTGTLAADYLRAVRAHRERTRRNT